VDVPAYSIFSAVSEVFVTIAVLYSITTNLKGNKLPVKLLGGVLAFEIVVNVIYMARMAGRAERSTELSTGMKLFFAGHGILSLVMILGLGWLYVLSVKDMKDGRETWFRRHRGGAWFFVFLWMVSVISGEVIFFMRYGGALFG